MAGQRSRNTANDDYESEKRKIELQEQLLIIQGKRLELEEKRVQLELRKLELKNSKPTNKKKKKNGSTRTRQLARTAEGSWPDVSENDDELEGSCRSQRKRRSKSDHATAVVSGDEDIVSDVEDNDNNKSSHNKSSHNKSSRSSHAIHDDFNSSTAAILGDVPVRDHHKKPTDIQRISFRRRSLGDSDDQLSELAVNSEGATNKMRRANFGDSRAESGSPPVSYVKHQSRTSTDGSNINLKAFSSEEVKRELQLESMTSHHSSTSQTSSNGSSTKERRRAGRRGSAPNTRAGYAGSTNMSIEATNGSSSSSGAAAESSSSVPRGLRKHFSMRELGSQSDRTNNNSNGPHGGMKRSASHRGRSLRTSTLDEIPARDSSLDSKSSEITAKASNQSSQKVTRQRRKSTTSSDVIHELEESPVSVM